MTKRGSDLSTRSSCQEKGSRRVIGTKTHLFCTNQSVKRANIKKKGKILKERTNIKKEGQILKRKDKYNKSICEKDKIGAELGARR